MAQKQSAKGDDVTLTGEQDDALGRAWATITDAEIEASIRWLGSLPPPTKKIKNGASPNGRQSQQ